MKNTLSENMLRFGTKNLSESGQKELIVKSIMETINQHGLHGAVRKRLTEADAPADPATTISLSDYTVKYKLNQGLPLVMQSPTSIKEASQILGGIMGAIGKKKPEQVQEFLRQINANNYPALLWKVRASSSFKNNNLFKTNFNTLGDYLSKFYTSSVKAGYEDSFLNGIIDFTRDVFTDTRVADTYNQLIYKFNIGDNMSETRGRS